MKRHVSNVFIDGSGLELDCGHILGVANANGVKWNVGDIMHCQECALSPIEGSFEEQPDGTIIFDKAPSKSYRIRATEILPFHQIGKREPLVRYYLEGNIKGGMKFADKRDAQGIVDALDHEQLTAVTFLIKFRHEVVED